MTDLRFKLSDDQTEWLFANAHLHTGEELARLCNVNPNYMYIRLRRWGLKTKQSPRQVREVKCVEVIPESRRDFQWVYPDLSRYFDKSVRRGYKPRS